MKIFIMVTSFAAALALAGSAQATQYVQNGNFSELSNGLGLIGGGGNTIATDWTTTGYNLVLQNATDTVHSVALWDTTNAGNSWTTGMAPNGDNFVAMDGDYGTAPITQTISGLTAGKTYTLSFLYAFAQQKGYTGDTIQSLAATLNGSPVFKSSNYSLPSKDFSGWSTYTTTVTATKSSEVLSFLATGNLPVPPFALLTDVSLTSAVPEPVTWAMMIVGLGAMGAIARRRRGVLATA